MARYTYQTTDGKFWLLEYDYEPYDPGGYWQPPEGGYAAIEPSDVMIQHIPGLGEQYVPGYTVADWLKEYDLKQDAVEEEIYLAVSAEDEPDYDED